MTESQEIEFWANQFYEHFYFIQAIFDKNGVLDDHLKEILAESQKSWLNIRKNPRKGSQLDSLLKKTIQTKEMITKRAKLEELPCVQDLLQHMKDELDYFDRAIVHQEWSLLEEMQWWATEHSEGLDFNNCQLPILIQLDSIMANVLGHPEEVDKIIHKNEELSHFFQELSREQDEKVLYQQLIHIKAQHIDGLSALIYRVKDLPLEDLTQKVLYDLLRHDSNEAEFAFRRLEKLRAEK